jgi:hypothetical protein
MSAMVAERIGGADRRRWPRAEVRLPVRLVDTEGSFSVLSGETVDISIGGMRARVDGPLAGSIEATARIDLTLERTVVCQAMVAGGGPVEGGWEYRLAFRDLDRDDIAELARIVDHAL